MGYVEFGFPPVLRCAFASVPAAPPKSVLTSALNPAFSPGEKESPSHVF